MKWKTLLLIFYFLLADTCIVAFLFWYSTKRTSYQGQFVRRFPPHFLLQPVRIWDIGVNSYYLNGHTDRLLYLGNLTAPFHLETLDVNTGKLVARQLLVDPRIDRRLRDIRVIVDSPYFYVTDGVAPALLHGTLRDLRAREYRYDSAFFSQGSPCADSAFVLRISSTPLHRYVIAKEKTCRPGLTINAGLLQKQVDGYFCTDGILQYCKELSFYVYLYYYRNQFVCFDSSLHLLYRGNTIDPVGQAQIKVARIASDKTWVLSAPPLLVNKKSAIYRHWLAVNSKLQASNDDATIFPNVSVVDLYELMKGYYELSFYLPDFKGDKPRDFQIVSGQLLALFDHYLVAYDISSFFHEP